MTTNNEKIAERFSNALLSQGIGELRIKKYKTLLRGITKINSKDFSRWTKNDIVNLLAKLQTSDYAENSKRDFRITVKKFFRWLRPDNKEFYEWVKTTPNNKLMKVIKTKDVLTESEVYNMVDMASHVRDKAIISSLFESASRIGELANLKIEDIQFDDKGYSFFVNGKTGEHYKRVMHPVAVELMRKWIGLHPMREDKSSALWVTLPRARQGIKKMETSGFRKMLREIGRECKIAKKLNPHSFRHAKITDMRVVKKIPDGVIEKLVGWKSGKMFETYDHSSVSDIDNVLEEVYDSLKEEKLEPEYEESLRKFFKIFEIINPELRKKLVGE